MAGVIQYILLALLIVAALVLPLKNKWVERHIEIFLFTTGVLACLIAQAFSFIIVERAFVEPMKIAAAVFIVGVLFKKYHRFTRLVLHEVISHIGLGPSVFLVVVVLGLTSSFITAIVAALILSEVVSTLSLEHAERVELVVYACFAISIGGILTPIGEPLGTIAVSKLQGEPHFAGTFFLFGMLWPYIFSANIILGLLAWKLVEGKGRTQHTTEEAFHTDKEIYIRTLKVYIFVAGLIFLGEGLTPLAYKTIFKLSPPVLYWVNLISAGLDNATLAAVEVVPEMTVPTLKYLIVSLILCGGMLIPANIPNIICASKLDIKSKEWARVGIPIGLGLMFFYFIILIIFVPYK